MEKPSPEQIEYQLEHYNDSYVNEIHISMSICLALATVAVILRILARRMNKASLGKDDHMIFVALFFAASYVTGNFVEHPVKVAKTILAIEILYQPSICCVKLSCLLLLHRLFPSRRLHIILWSVAIIIVIYTTTTMFVTIFACRPIRAAWDPSVTGAKCLNLNAAYSIQAIFNVITDFVILLLPMPILWRLQLNRNKKLQLISIFLTGSFVCAVSIWRVPHMKLANQDASYADAPASIWSGVEVCVGIVGACLPTLRPVVKWLSRSISKTVVKTVSKRSTAGSTPNTSYGREEPKSSEELGLKALTTPSSTYVPNRPLGTVARVEAPPFESAKDSRASEPYWRLDAGDDNV
ncbi:calcium-transporting ATpase [Physcia stellaris]|nr:calcium-transporting ATpase [Physcia stellaris]